MLLLNRPSLLPPHFLLPCLLQFLIFFRSSIIFSSSSLFVPQSSFPLFNSLFALSCVWFLRPSLPSLSLFFIPSFLDYCYTFNTYLLLFFHPSPLNTLNSSLASLLHYVWYPYNHLATPSLYHFTIHSLTNTHLLPMWIPKAAVAPVVVVALVMEEDHAKSFSVSS